jgi:hypothetical protein
LNHSKAIDFFTKAAFLSSLLVLFMACSSRGKVLAEVNGVKLYSTDAQEYMIIQKLSPDNPDHLESFIENWISQEVLKAETRDEFPELHLKNEWSAREVQYQLNLFDIENNYIESKLDTIVSEQDILKYYRQNKSNYLDKSFIVRALYIRIPDSISVTKNLETAFLLKNDKHREEVNRIGNLYATNFYFEEEKWIYFEDLVRDIPIPEGSKERLIVSKGNGIFVEDKDVFFLNILDYRIKNTTAPLEIEKENIKKIILKQRTNELRKQINQIIIDEIEPKHSVSRNY